MEFFKLCIVYAKCALDVCGDLKLATQFVARKLKAFEIDLNWTY
jgi:hypothetical protein